MYTSFSYYLIIIHCSYIFIYMYIYMYTFICIFICIYLYIYLYVYLYVYIYICIYMYDSFILHIVVTHCSYMCMCIDRCLIVSENIIKLHIILLPSLIIIIHIFFHIISSLIMKVPKQATIMKNNSFAQGKLIMFPGIIN